MVNFLKKKKIIKVAVSGLALLILISSFLYIKGFLNIQGSNTPNLNTEEKRLIVLISIDGLGANLIGDNTPYLTSLLEKETVSYTLDMQTIEQSETLPSHVSMLTGLKQESHKFYLNSLSPEVPPIEEKTLFDYAIENNYSFYSFLTKEKLLYLLGDKGGDNILVKERNSTELLESIDQFIEPERHLSFFFLHLRDLDLLGHQYGWNSDEQLNAAKTLDMNLKIITEDLREEFGNYKRYFIYTADHGGEGTQHSNGCEACRQIPFIVLSENSNDIYFLDSNVKNIYDTTCVVLDIMNDSTSRSLDCQR